MQSLREDFAKLSVEEKRRVHLSLCEHALSRWHAFCAVQPRILYLESVCGTLQWVDPSLPDDAFDCVRQSKHDDEIAKRYQEPIVAMQALDLELPDSVAFAYYSIYNLFRKYDGHESLDDWLIVNQALSSQQDDSKRLLLLESAVQKAK
jgi:hypothetical protein